MPTTLDLTKTLINLPSVTPNDHGCQPILIDILKQLNFKITSLPSGDADNFWAIRDQGAPVLVFAGHTDVVATGPLEEWLFPPFQATVDQGFLYGRGAADMKGSVAAMVIACQRFIERFPDYVGSIAFLITSAEEGPSELGTPVVIDYLKQIRQPLDYCVVGEPTASQKVGDVIKNGRRGSLSGKLVIRGKQGHIAYPLLADNPIPRSLRALHDLCNAEWGSEHPDFPLTTMQISNIHAGTGATNVTPGQLEVWFNFRYSPAVNVEFLKRQTCDVLGRYSLDYQLDWQHYGEPFLTQSGRLLDVCQQVIQEVCGFKPTLSTDGGTSDGRYIAKICREVIELGPVNDTIHKVNERVAVKDLETLTAIYERIFEKVLT